jgi:diguanylate cyclase (GGDEF)-like protein
VLICGGGGIYGIIGAYMREPDRFNEDSAAFLQNLANTISAFMERKLVEDRLSRMAQFDALTGLPNRTTYLDRLAHTLEEAGRDQRPVAVLFVDVDRFKAVNDTLGHAVGDALLVAIAKRLKDAVRSGDTIGRLSGDEFALVLAHLAREDHAGLVAQKITRALSTPFEIEGHTVYVSGSVGISLSPCDGTDPEVLLKNADLAMYRAKQSGRNGYQFYLPQMQERAVGRLRLETRLRDALERDEYVLHYQPKLDLRTGRVSGLEALLRWQSDDVLVSPTEFIGVLEDTGLIIPVGERVVSKVCAQIRAWQDAGIAPLPVAVNISARQFHQDRLDAVLARLLGESGVDPRLLELELTESLLMSDAEAAISTLRRIKDRGLLLALDDFGTGYSSLSYLKRFPLDAVKIDRAFIRDVMEDPSDASIVTAIVNLARNLELKVIAEGVETPQQMSFLRQRGCDEVQGHYIAPPMPAAQITQMLAGGQQWSLAATMSAMDADL